jgi:Uma2 family endonuclease
VNTGVILHQQLKVKNCGSTIYQPIAVKINEHTVVQPDLLIVCAPPSTRDKDLHTKKELYADFGIKYYLIIDPDNISIDIHLLNAKVYNKLVAPYQLEINTGCQINPDFKEVFD